MDRRRAAYLEPSEAAAERDNQENGWGLDPQLLHDVIHWHHKVRPFRDPNADIVNAVRRADWIDATQGKLRKGMPKEHVKAVEAAIPAEGFPDTLMRLAADLNGGKKLGGLMKVTRRVYKW